MDTLSAPSDHVPTIWQINPRNGNRNRNRKTQRRSTRPNEPTIPTPPAQLERFKRIMKNNIIGKPVEYGLAYPGTIRFLTDENVPYDWIRTTIHAYDRTMEEWLELIACLKRAKPTRSVTGNMKCPFSSRHVAGAFIEHLLYKNQRLRWTIRKFLLRVRTRIMDKRIVGTEDLCTTEAIPTHHLVTVYDIKTRNKYQFHTNTIARMIVTSLCTSAWGIPSPKLPTNPYTNIPWTTAQCMSIVSQIIRNQAAFHRQTNALILGFKQSHYRIEGFFMRFRVTLRVTAATNLFKDTANADSRELYNEILDYMFEDIPASQSTPLKLLKSRTFPEAYMKLWDKLVIGYFLHRNHGMLIFPYKSIRDLEAEFHLLNKRTYAYWVSNIRIVKRTRRTDTSDTSDATDATGATVSEVAVDSTDSKDSEDTTVSEENSVSYVNE